MTCILPTQRSERRSLACSNNAHCSTECSNTAHCGTETHSSTGPSPLSPGNSPSSNDKSDWQFPLREATAGICCVLTLRTAAQSVPTPLPEHTAKRTHFCRVPFLLSSLALQLHGKIDTCVLSPLFAKQHGNHMAKCTPHLFGICPFHPAASCCDHTVKFFRLPFLPSSLTTTRQNPHLSGISQRGLAVLCILSSYLSILVGHEVLTLSLITLCSNSIFVHKLKR